MQSSKRTITPFALLLATISAIIGSGWLFSSYYASSLSGPSSIISWIIGGIGVIIIAFTFAEICTLIPVTGSSTRTPLLSHGTLTSFIFSWMIWLSWMSMVPTEVQAVVQYGTYFFPGLTMVTGKLTNLGLSIAAIIMLILSAINVYSLRWLLKCNNILTILKFFIPLIIAIAILFHHHDMHTALARGFAPDNLHGILAALSSGGIVFAFNGFKQAAEMAGEAKNPSKAIPFAIVGSVLACLILFLLLQIAFLTSIIPSNIAHGWANISLYQKNSPLFSILQQDNLKSLNPLLAFTAVIAPLAAGLIYVSSSARSLYGISQNGHLPPFLQKCTPAGNPIFAIWINFIFGLILFFPLPGWDQMVKFLTSIITITYAIAPISLLALRKQLPNQKRTFRLPFAHIWCYIAFTLCTLFAYWSGWDILSKLDICIAAGLIFLLIYKLVSKDGRALEWNARESIWLWLYIIGLMLISYAGNYAGHDIFSEGTIFIIILVFCAVIMCIAHWCRLPIEQTQKLYKETLEI